MTSMFYTTSLPARQPETPYVHGEENLGLNEGSKAITDETIVEQAVIHDSIITTFASGLAIQHILTGFESCKIRVKFLPLDASHSEVKNLFVQRGLDPSQVFISGSTKTGGDLQNVDVICHQVARTALPKLGEFRGHPIFFEIVSDDDGENSTTSDQRVLTLTWSSPSFSCIVTLSTHYHAQQAVRFLNGKACNGRNVTIGLFPSSDSATAHCIIVHGLHPDTTDSMIKNFLRLGYWTLIERQPTCQDDSPSNVRTSLLRQFPLLCRMDDATTDLWSNQHSVKLHFPSWKEAKAAHDFFRQAKEFSDYPHLTSHLPDHWTYTTKISLPQYNAQRRQWNTIRNSSIRNASLSLTVSRLRSRCTLTLDGRDRKAAGVLKVQVDRLLAGEKLDVWHPFFVSPASLRILARVGNQTETLIQVDRNACLLKGFGTPERIQQAILLLKAEIPKLDEEERIVSRKRESVMLFTRQGLMMRIRQAFRGREKVSLNVASRPATVTICGGEAARGLGYHLTQESHDDVSSLAPLNSLEMCPVCRDNAEDAVRLDCQHVYCKACLKHYLSTAADNQRFPLLCWGNENSCAYPFPLPTIRKFLAPRTFEALLKSALDAYLATHPQDFKFCPTPDCRQVYRTTVTAQVQGMVCPSCFAEICTLCYQEEHDGMTCEEKRLVSDPSAEERATKELAYREGYKKCPTCQIWVEKTGGCNHMICRQCGAYFCWRCLKCFKGRIGNPHCACV